MEIDHNNSGFDRFIRNVKALRALGVTSARWHCLCSGERGEVSLRDESAEEQELRDARRVGRKDVDNA